MRTNIDIDEKLLKEAMKALPGRVTKKKAVEEALKLLSNIGKQSYIRSYRGKLKWSGNLNNSRQD